MSAVSDGAPVVHRAVGHHHEGLHPQPPPVFRLLGDKDLAAPLVHLDTRVAPPPGLGSVGVVDRGCLPGHGGDDELGLVHPDRDEVSTEDEAGEAALLILRFLD